MIDEEISISMFRVVEGEKDRTNVFVIGELGSRQIEHDLSTPFTWRIAIQKVDEWPTRRSSKSNRGRRRRHLRGHERELTQEVRGRSEEPTAEIKDYRLALFVFTGFIGRRNSISDLYVIVGRGYGEKFWFLSRYTVLSGV